MTGVGARVPRQENAFMRWLCGFAGYKKHLALSLMFIPVIVYFVIFKYIPMGGIVIAFKNYKISQGIWGSAWCGLDNFTKAFNTPTFARAVRNTLTISALKLRMEELLGTDVDIVHGPLPEGSMLEIDRRIPLYGA